MDNPTEVADPSPKLKGIGMHLEAVRETLSLDSAIGNNSEQNGGSLNMDDLQRGHNYMTTAKESDIWTPPPFHCQNHASSFPFVCSACRRHMCMAPKERIGLASEKQGDRRQDQEPRCGV